MACRPTLRPSGILVPDGRRFVTGTDLLPGPAGAERALRHAFAEIPGHAVERQRFAITVHYRRATQADALRIERKVDRVLTDRPEIPPIPRHWNATGYIGAIPVDPWGSAYAYAPTTPHAFVLRSLGADAAIGGTGASADVEVVRP